MQKRQGHALHELDMIVTAYGEKGICTRLYWSDGTVEEMPVRIGTMLRRIAEMYGKTPQSARKQWRHAHRMAAEEQFGKMAVLILSPGVMLMPVKLPEKMVGRDAAIGYVNLAQPLQFLAEKDGEGARSRIVFRQSDHAISSTWTCRTLEKHRAAARHFWLEEEQRYEEERRCMRQANVYLSWYLN